ncbi:MAG: cupin domain-containing protein [Verrucomicrobiota bacterium]
MPDNLLSSLPDASGGEVTEILLQTPGLRVERIVSLGQASPPDFWYDQAETEWVAVLSGQARLRLRDPDETRELKPGDWTLISAHRRHRVEWTAPGQPTVWLALFYGETQAETSGGQ